MNPLIARTFCRLQERLLGRPTFAIVRELDRSQHWPRERIEQLQLDRLRALVASAGEHTPYWREVMAAHGITPADIRSLADVRRFPLLTKDTLRKRQEDMVWREAGKGLRLVRTSGSTNEALQFYSNANREGQINAARIRGHRWIGVDKGEKEVYFWGSPVELSKQDRLKHVRDWFVNDGLTDGFEIRPESIPRYVRQWLRWRPKCIFGYPNSFVLVANMAAAQGVDLRAVRDRGLEVICTTSEMLTDIDRELIAGAFGVPVYDSYGVREGGLIGHECRFATMHTVDEQVLLETIDPETLEPTDGEGELVLTNLVSHVMPVIRYRTGDIVSLSDAPCECGLPLRSMRISGGRVADFVVTSDGKWVAGYFMIYICRSVKGIVRFQARQERLGELQVLLETDGNFPPDGAERVAAAVRDRLRSDDKITVELVDEIKPAPSGKYRPVIGKVAEQLGRGAAG